MMTIKEQFISEIKERIALQKDLLKRTEDSARIEGSIDALLGLLAFLDTLSEEKPSEDLEEAAEEYAYRGISDELKPLVKPLADEIVKNFIAGAEWQAEKCDEETSKLLYAERQTAYINGWDDHKEQMMKDAVEFECIGKKVKMTVQELINYYIDTECCDVADECGF